MEPWELQGLTTSLAASVQALESHARMRLLERVFDEMTPAAKSELANAMASALAKSDYWLASDFWKAALVALGPEAFAQEAALLEAIKKRILAASAFCGVVLVGAGLISEESSL